MNKNGRGDSRTRRRGSTRRKQFISIAVAIVVIYIVYRTFMPNSDNTFEPIKGTKITQNRYVQKEIRTEAPKFEQPNAGDIEVDDDFVDDDDEHDVDIDDTVIGNGDGAAIDKYSVQKSLEEQNKTEVKELNSTLSKANLTYASVNRTNPYQVQKTLFEQNKTEVKEPNSTLTKANLTYASVNRTNPYQGQKTLFEQNKTEVKELNTTFTKSNLTYTPVNRMNPFLSASNGSLSALASKLNMTSSARTVEVQTKANSIVRESKDLEVYKTKLAEGFAAQTKELANLVQNALNKKATNLTDISWQNKTKSVDGNLTKLVELFSFKAQNAMKLAKDLLFNQSASVPYSNQNTSGLNRTKIEGTFSVETQDLVNIANNVLSDTDKSAFETKNKTQSKVLDKYASDAQNLAKFASNLITNATAKVVETKQKLMNLDLPVAKTLPIPNDVKNMTEKILS
ncbi:uncharacterized protein LOC123524100 [Mercenaria mercenaria]|uniref:uncharacterized protein LOC123524100 n=1 Tax=Mercenaria mercenaria TaxID=6596 RepID=UPI00234EA27D|nr:uncharacterized protein LOC123524100 [Mercenaria mercenaria]XP_045157956.2 uncharacterized protein LOC123524100 [Mercenaria mercenaria]